MNSPRTIDVLEIAQTRYGVAGLFARDLHSAFVSSGAKSRLLLSDELGSALTLSSPEWTVGFNFPPRAEGGVPFCDFFSQNHLCCLLDPPYWFRNLTHSPHIALGCVSEDHCRFLRRRGVQALFIPHVAPELLFEHDPLPHEKRTGELIFCSSFIDYQQLERRWQIHFPPLLERAMKEAVAATFDASSSNYLEVMDEVTLSLEGSCPHDQLDVACQQVELYVKGREREQLLMAIDRWHVDLYGGKDANGKGWESSPVALKANVSIHGEVSYEGALDLLQHAKVSLSTSSQAPSGSHERPLAALAAGTGAVSTPSSFLSKTLGVESGLLQLTHDEFASLDDRLTAWLEDTTALASATLRGREAVATHHRWIHQVANLLEMLAEHPSTLKTGR